MYTTVSPLNSKPRNIANYISYLFFIYFKIERKKYKIYKKKRKIFCTLNIYKSVCDKGRNKGILICTFKNITIRCIQTNILYIERKSNISVRLCFKCFFINYIH